MAYKIIRKKRYIDKLVKVLAYIENEYGYNAAENFLIITDKKIATLKEHPFIGAATGVRDTRSLHITGHNRLFYRIIGSKIFLLNLYDTRKRDYQQPQ